MDENVFGGTAAGLHDTVMELMEEEPRGTVLDAPSGLGELSHLLNKNGFSVIAGDIDETVCKAEGVEIRKLDLNGILPFDNASLDYAICVEGVEHLENPHHTIRELARIIKPDGKIILTNPNVLNVYSRLRYLLIGYHEYFGDHFMDEQNFYLLHINPVGFPELHLVLRRCGFIVEKVTMNKSVLLRRGLFSAALMLLLLPVIRLITRLKVKDPHMRQHLLSRELLSGELLILKCRRQESDA